MARPRPTREDEPAHAAGDFAAVLRGMAHRLQLPALEARHSKIWVLGLFALVNGLLSMATMAAVAVVTGAPFIFPSLGPTAFLLFFGSAPPAPPPPHPTGRPPNRRLRGSS